MIPILLLLALSVTGCATWRPQGLTPEAVIAREHSKVLRVSAGNGPLLEMHQPHVEGDSLVGVVGGARTALPLRDVTRVEAARSDVDRAVLPFVFRFGVAALLYGASMQ